MEQVQKSNKKAIVVIVIVLLFLSAAAFSWYRQYGLLLKTIDSIPVSLPGNQTTAVAYKPTAPEIMAGSTVSQVIKAKDGGNIKLTDPNGIEVDLYIFPDSLEKDTEIKVSPLKKFPLENYGATLTPGVLIEPKTAKFKSPAILTFTFPMSTKQSGMEYRSGNESKPLPGINAASAKAATGPLTAEEMAEVMNNLPPLMPLPIGAGAADNRGAGGIISSNDASGTSGAVPSTTSSDGSSVTGPVNGGGSYAPDNIDGSEAKNLSGSNGGAGTAGTRGSGGGKCDQATANMIYQAMVLDWRAGDMSSYNDNKAALSKCTDELFESLIQKCQNNKIAVRRRDFNMLGSLFSLNGDRELAEQVRKLMETCTGRYSATGSHVLGSGVGGTATTQISAEVCGFIDDQWKGGWYLITAVETITNDITFTLPPDGGAVYQQHKGSAAGAVNMGISAAGVTGYYDGKQIFRQYAPRNFTFPVSIALVSSPCPK